MTTDTLEDRVTALEKELAQVKRQLQADGAEKTTPWWQQISGVFKDCPEFEEAVRLGREWRESQRMEYDDPAESEHGSA